MQRVLQQFANVNFSFGRLMQLLFPVSLVNSTKKASRSFNSVAVVLLLVFASLNSFGQSFRTPTFTGSINDFTAAERFAAAANNTTYAITFDATYMYFGAFRTSGNFGDNDNFTIYIDTDPRNAPASGNGTTAGRTFNGFTPTLPFNADYTSITQQNYTDPINRFNGTWASTGVIPTVNVGSSGSNFREVRIALADIGNPASVYVTLYMGYAGGIFSNAPGLSNEGTAATRTMTGYFGSFPVYKAGVTPFLTGSGGVTPNTTAANGGGTVIPNLSVVAGTSITAGDYGDITITSGASTSSLLANTSFTGSLTIGSGTTNATRIGLGTFGLFAGGRGVGGTAGQLIVNGSSGVPFTTGTGGSFNFLGAGLVIGANTQASLTLFPSSSTVTVGGAVDFGNVGGVTLQSGLACTLQINANGSIITNAPNYQSGSSLVYNPGGSYTAGLEWTTSSTSARGVPNAVTIQNSTAVNFGSSTAYRQANGLVTIGSGSSLTLSSASGGDLRIAGGLTNNNTGTGVGINTNGRAVQTMASTTTTYTKVGTDNLDFLIIGNTGQLTLASGTNLSLTSTNASGCLQFNANGSIFMGGTNTVSIANGGSVGGSSIGSIGGTSPITSILNLVGTTAWSPGGLITVSINVGIQVNNSLTITTAGRLSAGYLQINPGGFIGGTNPVVYPTSGTLVYNHSSGTYGVGANEWPSTSSPANVTVNANGGTGISFASNNITARTLAGTLNVAAGQNVSLTGSGTPNLTVLNTIAGAAATISGSGNYTHSASGTFTTANTAGINGTLITSGAITLPSTTSFVFNNATTSQVTGTLLPATVNNLTINNPTASTGTTISNNTLVIGGTTTLTAGALVLPTSAGNLVTFTGNISTPTGGGTITGSATSNIVTSGTTAGTANTLSFTSGGAALFNWTHGSNNFGSSASTGLASVVTINGTFSLLATGFPDFYTTSTGGLVIANGATYTDNGASNDRFLGAGSFNLQSGATLFTGNTSGINATSTASGAIQSSGTRTFSGGANYTFNNGVASAQAIGDALDATVAAGKTGPITGNVLISNNVSTGVTLNAGTTVTINTPGAFNIGVNATSSAILTAPATSVINGTGTINMFGNGATNGSTLVTAHASGVNGTFATTTTNLTNGANNNTNFTFNGSGAQVTGSLLPATVNNLNIANTFSGALATPSVTLSSSVTVNGTTTTTGTSPVGVVSIGAGNTLNLNGPIATTASKLIGTSTSNLIIGGSGAISAVSLFLSGGGTLNSFTMNRTGGTATIGTPLTVGGTYSSTAGVIAMGANTLTLNGPIAFGAATLTSTGALTIGGSGSISGSLLGTANPLALNNIAMDRPATTLALGGNTTVSNATGLTLTNGNISLGTFNLTNTNGAGTLGTGSTNSMIVATGSGQAFLSMQTGTSTKTFPIGDGANYTPAALSFTANAVTGTVGARVTAAGHPQKDNSGTQVDFLNRYWSFTTTGLTNYTYTSAFTYVPADINGTESTIKLNRWSGTAWTEDATSAAASNVLTSTTSLTNVSYPLSGDYTGRKEIAATDYVWNGSVSNNWDTAANWTPSGVPAALDNVTINVPGSFTNCSINSGTKTVNSFTLNGTGAFAMVSGAGINIGGTVTYDGTSGATASLDCASTFAMTSSSSQTVAALNYGNLNLTGGARVLASSGSIGICGTYTPGAGVITTTGNTINFNGSGAQTIPAFNYNNLTSSSTGARTLASSGTIGIGGTFTPGTNTYTNTGSTINYSSAGAQTITTFNYNSITNTGNGDRTLDTSGTIGIAATFTPGSGIYTVTGSTVDYNGTAGATFSAFTYDNLILSNNRGGGTLSFGSGIITIGGTFSFTATNVTQVAGTGTLVFNSTSSQTIPALNYFNLNTTGGPRTLASTGSVNIAGTVFTPGSGPFTITSSTVNFNGTTGFAIPALTTSGTDNYNNLTISGAGIYSLAATTKVAGNYSQSAGTMAIATGSTAVALNVTGNYIMTGGTLNVLASTINGAAGTVNVTGNTTTSGTASINLESVDNSNSTGLGIFQTTDFTTTSTSSSIVNFGATTVANNEFRVSGNFSKSGTGTFNTSSSSSATGFVFNKVGMQTFSYAGANSQYTQYTVSSGSTLSLSTSLTMGSGTVPTSTFTVANGGTLDMGINVISGTTNPTFTVSSGGTVKTANTGGLTSAITTPGTNVYNAAANYEFNGAAAQNTGFPTAVTTMNNLTINSTLADVKINKSFTVNGNLTMTSGNLDLNGSNNITFGTLGNLVSETSTKRIINTAAPTATNGWIGVVGRNLGVNPGNVANLGMNISVASAMGNTTIKRFPRAVSTIPTSLNSISRVYSIQPSTASTGSTIILNYFDGELNGNTKTDPSFTLYNSTGTNETVAANYLYAGASATDAIANTVTRNATNLTTTNTFWTALNTDQYFTAQTGDWNETTTWTTGVVPPANSSATVLHAVTVNAVVAATPRTVTVSTGGSLTFGASGSLPVSTTFTNSGSGVVMTSGGTLALSSGATFANGLNAFTGGAGTVAFAGTGTITGTVGFNNLTLNGATTIPTTITINGNLTFNSATASVSTAPTYGVSSNLIYAANVSRGGEWSTTSGAGYPVNVIVQNGGTLTASQSFDVGCSGNLQLGTTGTSGSLTMASTGKILVAGNVIIGSNFGTSTLALSTLGGGDIKVGGNWNRTANGIFTPNGRAVFFTGSGTNVINSTDGASFAYLVSEKTGGSIQLNSNLAVNAPNTGNALLLKSAAGFDLNGFTLNLTNAAASNVQADGGVVNFTGTGTINFSSATKTFTQINSGSFSFGNNVSLTASSGVNFGAGLSTVNGSFQINGGGFVDTNAPIYSSSSTLVYNSNYGRNLEWSATSGAGYPNNVLIQNNSTVDLAANGFADRAIAGNLTLGSGASSNGSLTMSATTGKLTVNGNVLIGGNTTSGASVLTFSSNVASAGIEVRGNWTRNSLGSFNDNGRATFFIGSGTSTITTNNTAQYTFLFINKTGGGSVVLSNAVNVSNTLSIANGALLDLGTFTSTTTNLTTNGNVRSTGTSYGGGSNSPAAVTDATFFSNTSGYLNVGTCGTYSLTSTTVGSPSCSGSAASVTLANTTASNLPIGTYAVFYTLTGANTGSFSAIMTVSSAGSGTFTTGNLSNTGSTSITVDYLRNGCVSSITSGNNSTFTVNPSLVASVSIAITAGSQTICSGTSVTFTATPNNGGTPSYQWKVNGVNAGTNSSTFATATLVNNDAVTVVMTSTASPCIETPTATSNAIVFTVNTSTAPAASAQTFCGDATVAQLTATGSALQWYNVSTGGSALSGSTALATGTYYVSQTLTTCESARTAVEVTVNTTPTLVITNPAGITAPATANLTAPAVTAGSTAGLTFGYFTDAAGTIAVADATAVGVGTYYIVGTSAAGCSSAIASVTVSSSTTIYVAGAWTNGVPNSSLNAIIQDNFTLTSSLSALTLTVDAGYVITVASGTTLTVVNEITNNAGVTGIVVENNGVLLQTSTTPNGAETALATVYRNSSNLYRQDYTLWSSPVSGQNLRAFSTMTLFNRFFSYNTAGGTNGVYAQELVSTNDVNTKLFVNAKGYLIRMPSDWPEFANAGTPGTPFVGIFRGTLNNGTITIPLSIANTGYNLVGNPYPSPISISAFFAGNSGIQQTLYFWRKRNGVPGSGYATTTELGLASAQSEVQGLDMQNTIKPGQGFFVKSTGSTNLTFTNAMRTNTASTPFLRTANTTELHRFWLNLSTATDVVGQTLIGYTTGASQGFDDGIDAPYFNDSPLALTSLIGGNEHIIQGRSVPFATTDVVPLGFKSDVANNFTISLSNFDGLFSGSQDIFLKDNLTGALQNLKLGDYTFSSAIGVFNTRFEVQFINTLGTDNPGSVSTKILVAVKDQVIKINAADVMIKKVDLVDVTGRVIYTQDDVNATTATIENILATNQMLIVRITTQSNGVLNQKIIY